MTLTVGSLFAGIGGFDLGLERAGMKVIWQSEIDPYASAVLRKHWPKVPNHGDIRTIRAATVERPDVLCGGFPCQPASVAGKRLGREDDRWLWPEYKRLIKEQRPTWVVGENVIGIVSMELDNVLADLEGLGYSARTFDIPACAVGAHHQRRRCWIVAHADDGQRERADGEVSAGRNAADSGLSSMAHPANDSTARLGQYSGALLSEQKPIRPSCGCASLGVAGGIGRQGRGEPVESERPRWAIDSWDAPSRADSDPRSMPGRWLPEPGVGRVAHGIPNRAHRLRGLGNAIVPQIAEIIGRAIIATKETP